LVAASVIPDCPGQLKCVTCALSHDAPPGARVRGQGRRCCRPSLRCRLRFTGYACICRIDATDHRLSPRRQPPLSCPPQSQVHARQHTRPAQGWRLSRRSGRQPLARGSLACGSTLTDALSLCLNSEISWVILRSIEACFGVDRMNDQGVRRCNFVKC
jgi:hypothetical protein